MALILQNGSPLPAGSLGGGSAVFVAGGRAMFRNISVPVRPATIRQLAEVAGVAAAGRAWANNLDQGQRDDWDLLTAFGLSGIEVFIFVRSVLEYLDDVLPFDAPAVLPSADVAAVDFSVSPDAGAMDVEVGLAVVETDDVALVSVSRPLRVGRVPVLGDLRLIATASPNVETDIAADYVERFGSLPMAGSAVMCQCRIGNPVLLSCSSAAAVVVYSGAVSDSFVVIPDPFESLGGFPAFLSGTADFAGESALVQVSFAVLTASWSISTPAVILNRETVEFDLTPPSGSTGSGSVLLRATSSSTGASVEISVGWSVV